MVLIIRMIIGHVKKGNILGYMRERERERICMGLVWEWGYARKAQLAHSNLTSIDVTTNPDPKVVYMRAL